MTGERQQNPLEDEFFEMVDNRVLDDYIAQKAGHDANKEVDLGTLSYAETSMLIDCLIIAYNRCLGEGSSSQAAICYRLIQRFIDVDEDLASEFENQDMPPEFRLLFGGQGPF